MPVNSSLTGINKKHELNNYRFAIKIIPQKMYYDIPKVDYV